MNKALLNQPRQSLRVWIALFASVSIHAAAVAIATLDRETIPTATGPTAPGDPEVIFENFPTPQVLPEDIEPIETPPPPPADDNSFPDEAATPTPSPQRMRKTAPPLPQTTSIRASGLTSGSARVLALSAPRPEYPYEARRQRLTGDGVAMIAIDPASGVVVNVTMAKSTGTAVLDQATIAGLRRWHFNAGTPATVRCPITFTLTGAMF